MSNEKEKKNSDEMIHNIPKPVTRTCWWRAAKEKYIKDGKKKESEIDPELDAQKIYQHYLNSFK